MTNKTFRDISWYEIEMNIKLLAQKIKQQVDLTEIKGITGIERGGLIPAVMLSHCLGLKYFTNGLFDINDKFIFVDDIADTGDKLKSTGCVQDIICSLYLREHTCSKKVKDRLIFAEKIENDDYLNFPWEIVE